MAETWIEEQREQLTERYNKCKAAEPVLEAFSVYLLRILNGLAQMESSKLYGYESQILRDAMKLFCMHYTAQVDDALEQKNDNEKKKKIIKDIEGAISKISNVYKNVIDSTANSDRQIFTSQAVETSIYDISPKLFATYSAILETLVRLFGKQEVYAFLLHPSLKSNIETVGLFEMREQEGKVVLIYIPENEIERISRIPIIILHEVFHVLTKEERNRKDRARHMEIHIRNAILQRIFYNVNFDFIDEVGADGDIKEKLMKRWFDVDQRIEEIIKIEKNDRRLYSKNILAQISENWRQWLSDIFVKLGDDLCQALDGTTYKSGENPYVHIMEIEWEIQRNLVEILAGDLVMRYANMYMSIYRETYADVASILTIGISPEEYEQAFKDSEMASDVLDQDIIRSIRVYIVARAIVACRGVKYAEEWKRYCEEHDFRNQKQREEGTGGGDKKNNRNVIQILDDDLNALEEILTNCSTKLWDVLGKENSKYSAFRDIIGEMDLIKILNGSINEKLRKL